VDPVTGQTVPEWKLREFEDLKSAVASMWEQLDVPAEEVTAFLSEADLMAPYSAEGMYFEWAHATVRTHAHAMLFNTVLAMFCSLASSIHAVLDMYQDMYRRLSNASGGVPAPALTNGSGMGMGSGNGGYNGGGASSGNNRSPGNMNGGGYNTQGLGPATTPSMSSMPRGGISPLPMSAPRGGQGMGGQGMSSAGGAGARPTSGGRGAPAATSGFRSTGFGKNDDYYGSKAKTLPPSMGGPGSSGRTGSPSRR
jgi:hypothetical protein